MGLILLAAIAIPLVVISNLNVECITGAPAETDPPLVVHTHAVLSGSVSDELLEPVSRRYSQIVQAFNCIKHEQLSSGKLLDIWSEPSGSLPIEQPLCVSIREASDHAE